VMPGSWRHSAFRGPVHTGTGPSHRVSSKYRIWQFKRVVQGNSIRCFINLFNLCAKSPTWIWTQHSVLRRHGTTAIVIVSSGCHFPESASFPSRHRELPENPVVILSKILLDHIMPTRSIIPKVCVGTGSA
jgi:hypothetical protein